MAKGPCYRQHSVTAMLSDDEYQELRRLCALLKLPVRELLLIGMRRARRILADEQRRQHHGGSA
jgi:hypothetical protein